jgi:hypothetical protein
MRLSYPLYEGKPQAPSLLPARLSPGSAFKRHEQASLLGFAQFSSFIVDAKFDLITGRFAERQLDRSAYTAVFYGIGN